MFGAEAFPTYSMKNAVSMLKLASAGSSILETSPGGDTDPVKCRVECVEFTSVKVPLRVLEASTRSSKTSRKTFHMALSDSSLASKATHFYSCFSDRLCCKFEDR